MTHTDLYCALSQYLQVQGNPVPFTLKVQQLEGLDAELLRLLDVTEKSSSVLTAGIRGSECLKPVTQTYELRARRDAVTNLPSALAISFVNAAGAAEASAVIGIRGGPVKVYN